MAYSAKMQDRILKDRVLEWHAEIGQATNIFSSALENHFVTKI